MCKLNLVNMELVQYCTRSLVSQRCPLSVLQALTNVFGEVASLDAHLYTPADITALFEGLPSRINSDLAQQCDVNMRALDIVANTVAADAPGLSASLSTWLEKEIAKTYTLLQSPAVNTKPPNNRTYICSSNNVDLRDGVPTAGTEDDTNVANCGVRRVYVAHESSRAYEVSTIATGAPTGEDKSALWDYHKDGGRHTHVLTENSRNLEEQSNFYLKSPTGKALFGLLQSSPQLVDAMLINASATARQQALKSVFGWVLDNPRSAKEKMDIVMKHYDILWHSAPATINTLDELLQKTLGEQPVCYLYPANSPLVCVWWDGQRVRTAADFLVNAPAMVPVETRDELVLLKLLWQRQNPYAAGPDFLPRFSMLCFFWESLRPFWKSTIARYLEKHMSSLRNDLLADDPPQHFFLRHFAWLYLEDSTPQQIETSQDLQTALKKHHLSYVWPALQHLPFKERARRLIERQGRDMEQRATYVVGEQERHVWFENKRPEDEHDAILQYGPVPQIIPRHDGRLVRLQTQRFLIGALVFHQVLTQESIADRLQALFAGDDTDVYIRDLDLVFPYEEGPIVTQKLAALLLGQETIEQAEQAVEQLEIELAEQSMQLAMKRQEKEALKTTQSQQREQHDDVSMTSATKMASLEAARTQLVLDLATKKKDIERAWTKEKQDEHERLRVELTDVNEQLQATEAEQTALWVNFNHQDNELSTNVRKLASEERDLTRRIETSNQLLQQANEKLDTLRKETKPGAIRLTHKSTRQAQALLQQTGWHNSPDHGKDEPLWSGWHLQSLARNKHAARAMLWGGTEQPAVYIYGSMQSVVPTGKEHSFELMRKVYDMHYNI